ncbi:MAG: hypothetical protein ACR2FR_04280 [Rubrobacter sp.]
MNLPLYYAALEHHDRIDQDVVMPSVSWRTARRHVHKAPVEPSTL